MLTKTIKTNVLIYFLLISFAFRWCLHWKTIGDIMAKLHTEQQTGSVDETASMSIGTESDDKATRSHRILVTSNNFLLGSKVLSKDLLLDLSTWGKKIKAWITLPRCDLFKRSFMWRDCQPIEGNLLGIK